jgi:two-component system, sensor histidine kinase and response regulator
MIRIEHPRRLANAGHAQPSTDRIAVRSSVSPSTILIIDDNAQNRALFTATLQDEGFAVAIASGGHSGVDAFRSEHIDCVLLDVRMPDMDGFAACQQIRQLAGGASVPIIFLTALRDVDTFDQALAAGGDDFLTKPVSPTELVVRVKTALKLSELSGELRANYEILRKQRDDMLRLQLQKERLMSFLIHDLKTPVNGMDLHAQLLARDPGLSDKSRRSVAHIRNEARSLLRMLLNLLDIGRSEEGQLSLHPSRIDLDALIAEVIDLSTAQASEKGVYIRQTPGAGIAVVDADLIRRVVENLLDNAVRYAPKGSDVIIATVRDSDCFELAVRDFGVGVAPAMAQQLFHRYTSRGDDVGSTKRSNRGLGLAFCKLAVEAHGGTVTVQHQSPGTIFSVRIPYAS